MQQRGCCCWWNFEKQQLNINIDKRQMRFLGMGPHVKNEVRNTEASNERSAPSSVRAIQINKLNWIQNLNDWN
jgi:hypothetical protein